MCHGNGKRKLKNKKLILAVIAIVILVCCAGLAYKASASKTVGTATIELVDLQGKTVDTKDVEFKKGDTLVSLCENNFENVKVDHTMLMTIGEFTSPADWSQYIAIWVDDKMSEVGITDIELKDGIVVSFRMPAYTPQ